MNFPYLRIPNFSELRTNAIDIRLRKVFYKVTVVGNSKVQWPGKIEIRCLPESGGASVSVGKRTINTKIFEFSGLIQFVESRDIRIRLIVDSNQELNLTEFSVDYDITTIVEKV